MKKKIAFLTFSSELLQEDKIFSSKLHELIEKDCKLDIQYRWFENNQRKTPQKIVAMIYQSWQKLSARTSF